jgi:hypothetical protein
MLVQGANEIAMGHVAWGALQVVVSLGFLASSFIIGRSWTLDRNAEAAWVAGTAAGPVRAKLVASRTTYAPALTLARASRRRMPRSAVLTITIDDETMRFAPVGRARGRADPFTVIRSEVASAQRTNTRVDLDLGASGVLVLVTGAWKVITAWCAGTHELPSDGRTGWTSDEVPSRPARVLAGTTIRLDR